MYLYVAICIALTVIIMWIIAPFVERAEKKSNRKRG